MSLYNNLNLINKVYFGASQVISIYLGSNIVWPEESENFWSNISPNNCVNLQINSSQSIPNGINGSISILTGLNTYQVCI